MHHHTIMVVDDTPDHRSILCRLLSAEGYQVLEVSSHEEAIEQAGRARPDLILMALSLPGHPAWELVQQLHRMPALAHTPILGTTIYNTLLSSSRIRSLGCIDFIDKPFDIDELLRRINMLLFGSAYPVIAA